MKQDDRLVQRISRRDSRGLEETIERYGDAVFALCARVLAGPGRSEDVEECVSDTFLAAWQRIMDFRPERGEFRTWLLMLARFKALDRRRRLENAKSEPDSMVGDIPDPSSETGFGTVENREALAIALGALDRLDRDLVYGRYYLYRSIDQLASEHGITASAVHNRLWRARKTLREALETGTRKGVDEHGV